MKFTASIFLAIVAATSFAQDEIPAPTRLSPATLKYEAYRAKSTEPTYGLKKVKGIIAKIKTNKDFDKILDTKIYDALNFEEKFTFTMLHGEFFSQNCSEMPIFTHSEKKIFAYPIGAFNDEAMWSERQQDFLKKNRTKVIGLIRSTIQTRGRVGANLRIAILELDAVELIPDMIRTYGLDRKDHDILSSLLVMMNNVKYKPFLASHVYKKLFADENNSYKAYLEATKANEDQIIRLANAYFKDRKRA